VGKLEQKVALVTGAASGIGRAMSLRLAAEGASVMCSDVDEEGAQHTAAQIDEHGGTGAALQLDVTDEEAVRAALHHTVGELGGIDVLVNNAGIGGGYSWEQTAAVNLSGVYYGLLHGAHLLAHRGGGSIVNTASVAGLVGLAGGQPAELGDEPESAGAAYVAAKHGVVGLTRQFAVRYARHGVRVNAVCPGYIDTPMIANLAAVPEGRRFLESMHPMGRLGRVEEIAAATAFLASDDASFITGVALPVDGGYTAR
jgi:NAD(P)-dependent dehydrogenase (short-subunit alcohol dehydrogenase family)